MLGTLLRVSCGLTYFCLGLNRAYVKLCVCNECMYTHVQNLKLSVHLMWKQGPICARVQRQNKMVHNDISRSDNCKQRKNKCWFGIAIIMKKESVLYMITW